MAFAVVMALAAASACASDDDDREAATEATVATSTPGPTAPLGPSASTDEGKGLGAGPWHTDGSRIVDAAGRSVRVAGVNLFGFESTNLSPLGLWTVNYRDMLGQIRAEGYNLLRIPWSNQMLDQGAAVSGIDYHLNPDLVGLSPIEVLDRVVVAAGQVGLKVLLDRHRPDASGQSALWYTVAYPEQRWLDDWVLLAERYRANPTVIGADLHNEPPGPGLLGLWSRAVGLAAGRRAGRERHPRREPRLADLRAGRDQLRGAGHLVGRQPGRSQRASGPSQRAPSPRLHAP